MKFDAEAYILKRFGTYWVEVDSDDPVRVSRFIKELKRATRWRFIKFVVVPKHIAEIKKIEVKDEI